MWQVYIVTFLILTPTTKGPFHAFGPAGALMFTDPNLVQDSGHI